MTRKFIPQPRSSSHLGKGLFYALLLHLSSVGPLVALALVWGAREAAEREAQVDVSWETIDPATLPQDLPPLAPEPPPPAPRELRKVPRDEVAKVEPEAPPKPPEPETPPQPEPPPPPEPEAPRPPQERYHQKVVELDPDNEAPPPDQADYLANKNSRTDKETRAQDTNLEKERRGEQTSSPSTQKADRPGDDKDEIAQLEETPSKTGRRAPAVTPRAEPQAAASAHGNKPSVLSMRSNTPRTHMITPETVNPNLPLTAEGDLPMPNKSLKSLDDLEGSLGPRVDPRLRLSAQDYEYLFGEHDDAARALADKQRSTHKGRFTQRLEQGRAALENFIPEVQPGNQTALNARAAPFAAFIAAMHRTIHQLWGWGFLDDLAGRPHTDPLNNPNLLTKLEIVLGPDGTIDNVKVIRTSGLSMFDVAAVDVVHSAGPYPEPPREIHSKNGKVYLHWTFHRDERQCATFGAEPYIIDNPPAGSDQVGLANVQPRAAATRASLERLSRDPVPRARARQEEGSSAAHTHSFAHEEPPRGGADSGRAADPLARQTAEAFFQALVRGDVRQMVKQARFPFQNLSGAATPSASVLQNQLGTLVDEIPTPRKLRGVSLHTGGGLRSAGVRPPEAFATNPSTLFAVGVVSGETLIAALTPDAGAWKVAGLFR
ncbi:MAG: energy transducer TonB [Myxococcales bacterium]|nr:energy transducer TonB [Myxococcales bacterium]